MIVAETFSNTLLSFPKLVHICSGKINQDLTASFLSCILPFRYLNGHIETGMAFEQDLMEHLKRLKNGDRQSFKIVYEQYVNALHSFVLRFVKSSTIADDVVQEVFIKIWEKRESIETSKSFQAFLYTIAKNLVLNKFAQSRREMSMLHTIMEAAQKLSNKTEEDIYFKETSRFIKEGVDKLPPQQKNIYDLCKNQGLTYDQVAEKLELSSHTINAQMVSCLRALKQYLASKESS